MKVLTLITKLLLKTAIGIVQAGLIFSITAFTTYSLSGISAVFKHIIA